MLEEKIDCERAKRRVRGCRMTKRNNSEEKRGRKNSKGSMECERGARGLRGSIVATIKQEERRSSKKS